MKNKLLIQSGTIVTFGGISMSRFLMVLTITLLFLLSISCAKAVRMQAKYDDEPQNSLPKTAPSPTPPGDLFSWGQIDITARVVSGSSGNRVRVSPSPGYISAGKYRAFVLNAFSEPLTIGTSTGVRGGVTVTMQGFGRMVIAVRSAQATSPKGDPLGGYFFINVGIPSIGYMSTQNLKVMQLNNAVLNSTMLSPYTSGQPVELRWSIDQSSRTIGLGATPLGGSTKTASVQFDAVATDGTPNTPLQKIMLMIEMFEVPQTTQVFFDDFYVEEY